MTQTKNDLPKQDLSGEPRSKLASDVLNLLDGRSLVFVGLMSVGKSTIGRRIAHLLDLPFKDSDTEIELAAGRSVPEIFRDFGEPAFREGERKVIKRVLEEERLVLATGGGAFMDEETRVSIQKTAVSVWLDASIDILVERVGRNDSRPLLAGGNARKKLSDLAVLRNPTYALADIKVVTDRFTLNESCGAVLEALSDHLKSSEQPK